MTGSFQDGRVQECIAGAVIEFDETKPLACIEPLDGRIYCRATGSCLSLWSTEVLRRPAPICEGFVVVDVDSFSPIFTAPPLLSSSSPGLSR
jgi:hypothetical protein